MGDSSRLALKQPRMPAAARSASMRTVAIGLIVLAVAPVLALAAWGWSVQKEALLRRAADDLAEVINFVGGAEDRLIEGTRQLLGTVASAPPVVEGDWVACDVFLRRLGARFPAYLAFGVIDLQGQILCTSMGEKSRLDLRDEPNFKRALQAPEFTVGRYGITRLANVATVPFFMPVQGPNKERVALAFTSVDLIGMQQRLESLNLPEAVNALVTDASGVVLADARGLTRRGTPPADAELASALARGHLGTLQTTDAQGRRMQHLIRATELGAGDKLVFVASSSYEDQVTPALRRLELLLAGVLVAGGLYAALLRYLASRWIFKPLQRVTRDMHLIEADSYEAPHTAKNSFVREIDTLHRGLDAMWHALARRARESSEARGAANLAQHATTRARDEMVTVLNEMNEGFMVLTKSWHIKSCNTRGAALLSGGPEELDGHNFWALFPGADNQKHRRTCERQLSQGKPCSFEEFHPNHKRWLDVRVFVSGDDIGVFLIDSTDHWKMLDEMVQREHRYRELFEANPNVMTIYDAETFEFLAVNAAALEKYGYSNEEFLQLPPGALSPPEDWVALVDDVRRDAAPKAEPSAPRIYRQVTAKGEVLLVEVARYPIAFNGRRAIVAMATDITRRTRSESALRTQLAAQKKKQGEVVAVLTSYEHMARANGNLLRGEILPLLERTARLGTLEQLSDAPAEVRGYVAGLLGQTRLTHGLLRDVLRLAEVSRAPCGVQPFDLARLAARVVTDLRAREPKLEVSVEIQSAMPCQGDPALVRVLLEALIGNALKFTSGQPGAWINIGMTHKNGSSVPTYTVADNGCGFDPGEHDRMFLPFERAHAHGEFHGHGIGLALARAVVARHGGHVWGVSRARQGATFHFELGPQPQTEESFVREVVIDSPPEPEDDDPSTGPQTLAAA